MLRFIIVSALSIFISISLFGQIDTVVLRSEIDSRHEGRINLFATNNSPGKKYVVVNFKELVNITIPSGQSYLDGTLSNGSSLFAVLLKTRKEDDVVYDFSYDWMWGCKDTEHNKDIVYFMPLSENSKSKVTKLGFYGDELKMNRPYDFYKLGFEINKGSHISASRKGLVVDVGNDRNDYDYILIQHKDCTMAKYEFPSSNRLLVSVGQRVYPGENILELTQVSKAEQKLEFSIIYPYKYDQFVEGRSTGNYHNYGYIKVPFYANNSILELKENVSYSADHTEDIIISELSKAEHKKWNNGKLYNTSK